MQRISNCDKIQNNYLTPDKVTDILVHGLLRILIIIPAASKNR